MELGRALGTNTLVVTAFFNTVFIKEVFENQSMGAGENPITVPAESAVLVWILSGCWVGKTNLK